MISFYTVEVTMINYVSKILSEMNYTNKQLPAIPSRKMRSDAVLFYFLIDVSDPSVYTIHAIYTTSPLVTQPSQL